MAGHSLGAVTAMLVAGQRQQKCLSYLGFDPVTIPSIGRIMASLPMARSFIKTRFEWARKAGKRRANFDSLEQAYDYHNSRGTFRYLPDDVVKDYIEGGTIAAEAGGIQLSCPPSWEQAIYAAQAQNVYKVAELMPENSTIIYAGKQAASSAMTRRAMGKAFAKGDIFYKPDWSHFFPLIKHEASRDFLLNQLKAS